MITLKYVIASYLNQANIDEGDTSYERYLQLAVEGISQINKFHLRKTPKEVSLELNDAGVVLLPSDFIDSIAVGYNLDGRFMPISCDANMVFNNSEECGADTGTNQKVPIEAGNHLTSGGGWDDYYYKIDKNKRTLAMSGAVPGNTILLRYISSGVSTTGETLVPEQALQCLKQWLHWKGIEMLPNVPQHEKIYAMNMYDREVSNLRQFEYAFDINRYKDLRNRAAYNGVKY